MRILHRWVVLAAIVAAFTPAAALAGDSPYFTVGGWGVGTIDGRLLIYLGHDHCLPTPVPSPPEGPRWDVAYAIAGWSALPAVGGAALLWCRRRGHGRPARVD